MDLNDTSLATAQANILANSQAMVQRLNADLVTRYQGAYADYLLNMHSGGVVPPERRNPPAIPNAWELAPADANGFVFYQIGTRPVVDPAAYPATYYAGGNPQPNTAPNVIMVGARNGDTKWFTALKGDTFPSGMTTPPGTVSVDGVSGTFQKFGAPVGPGWYLLIS